MDYQKAFIKLYGATGVALDRLHGIHMMNQCLEDIANILKKAICEVEEMNDEHEE